MHDRSKFQIFGFALSPNDGSEYRAKIESTCDVFLDLSSLTDGYKIAEIIFSYMGFPGSLGADYIEYLISDKVTTPSVYTNYYSEFII